jgi:hypothetical protein
MFGLALHLPLFRQAERSVAAIAAIDGAVGASGVNDGQPTAAAAASHRARHGRRGRTSRHPCDQARYEASLAERRYAACDPDNRLIAATLEKNWERALRRVHDCEARLDATITSTPMSAVPDLSAIAEDLEAVRLYAAYAGAVRSAVRRQPNDAASPATGSAS